MPGAVRAGRSVRPADPERFIQLLGNGQHISQLAAQLEGLHCRRSEFAVDQDDSPAPLSRQDLDALRSHVRGVTEHGDPLTRKTPLRVLMHKIQVVALCASLRRTSMPMTKRIQYHQYGGPELMRLEDVEVPAPGKRQVLIRVLAASVNAVDWHIRNGGLRLLSGRRFPRGMGGDFAGVVEQVGQGVTRLKAGD
jgi:hypothetical protein